jgi:hypothetical protein
MGLVDLAGLAGSFERRLAAKSNGAIKSWALRVQWEVGPEPDGLAEDPAASTRDFAEIRAPAQLEEDSTGDQPALRMSDASGLGMTVFPLGSKIQQRPRSFLFAAVSAKTSGLVEVETTAPGKALTFGTTMPVVFPDLGGPMTNRPLSIGHRNALGSSSAPTKKPRQGSSMGSGYSHCSTSPRQLM